jgi:hypothetical protein
MHRGDERITEDDELGQRSCARHTPQTSVMQPHNKALQLTPLRVERDQAVLKGF